MTTTEPCSASAAIIPATIVSGQPVPVPNWVSAETLALVAASTALFVAFVWHLKRVAAPIIPLDVLYNPLVLTATLAATLSVGLFLGLAIYTPILFEVVRGLTASQSGLALLPLTVGTVGGALIAGKAMARMAHYKRVPLVALPCVVIFALVLMAGAGTLPVWGISLALAVISTALGTLLPISTVSIQNAVALHQLGTATAAANLCRQLGGAIMVAIFGTIVVASGAGDMAHPTAAAIAPLVAAFRIMFGLVALGGLAAFATIVAMEERPLRGPDRRAPTTTSAAHLSAGE